MSQLIELLKQFDDPQICEAACREVFGQSRHFAVPAMIKGAVKDGYLQVLDNDGPVVDSAAVYSRDLLLTPKGREFCGFPPLTTDVPKPKKKSQPSLF